MNKISLKSNVVTLSISRKCHLKVELYSLLKSGQQIAQCEKRVDILKKWPTLSTRVSTHELLKKRQKVQQEDKDRVREKRIIRNEIRLMKLAGRRRKKKKRKMGEGDEIVFQIDSVTG